MNDANHKPTPSELREALRDILKICRAVQYQVGLGKGQIARIERAEALLKQTEASGNG